MSKIPLAAWRPDQPTLGGDGLPMVLNCLQGPGYYRPIGSPQAISATGFEGIPNGIWVAERPNGELLQFVASDGVIYRVPGRTTTPVNVSPDYDYDDEAPWTGVVQYGPELIVANYQDAIQVIDLADVDDSFHDLSNEAPKARYLAVVKDLIVAANTFDLTDGAVGTRVRWHGINDPATGLPNIRLWDVSVETRADFQDIPDIGNIQGITGGEFGSIICAKGISRLSFGGSYVFNANTVVRNVGCTAPGSIAQYVASTFFLGDDGVIYRFDGSGVAAVNKNKNDVFLKGDIDLAWLDRMTSVADPGRGIIFWSYAGSGNISGQPNRLLAYSIAEDEFTVSEIVADRLGPVLSFARDLDDENDFPDLDSGDLNLDDPRLWVGGFVQIGMLADGELRGLSGPPLTGAWEIGDLELSEGRRAVLNRALIHHDGGTVTLRIGTREKVGGPVVWSGAHAPQSDGFFKTRATGRYHRIRIEAAGDWRKSQSAEIWGAGLGMR
jgi:hypothetical protein